MSLDDLQLLYEYPRFFHFFEHRSVVVQLLYFQPTNFRQDFLLNSKNSSKIAVKIIKNKNTENKNEKNNFQTKKTYKN